MVKNTCYSCGCCTIHINLFILCLSLKVLKDHVSEYVREINKNKNKNLHLSWKVQYLMPSFVKNSNAALSRLLALAMELLPSSQGRIRVGKPNGSAPDESEPEPLSCDVMEPALPQALLLLLYLFFIFGKLN